MVIARLLAELTVLVIVLSLPAILLLHGDFFRIAEINRVLVCIVSVGALILLPAYGFITYEVVTTDDGIQARSIFQKPFLNWRDIESLRLKTIWGSRRYFLTANDGSEASFPVWIMNVRELTEEIRARLPNRGRISAGGGIKTFHQSLPSMLIQAAQLVGSFVFIGVLWGFYYSMDKHHRWVPHNTDAVIILSACVLFTCMMLMRCGLIMLMPRTVKVEPTGIALRTLFFERSLAWSDVLSVGPPFFFLPEGLLLRSARGMFLIGDHIDGFDELEEDLVTKSGRPFA